MGMLIRRCKLVCSLVLILALTLSGCAGAGVMPLPPTANLAVLAVKGSSAGDKAAMLRYLQAAQQDLAIIDAMLADQDLGLLDDDTSGSDEFTTEAVNHYLDILGGYDTQMNDQLTTIESRDAPNHPDIASFRAAEISEFETAADVAEEYMQVLKYINSLYDISDEMAKLGNGDANDLEGTYQSINDGITSAINELKNSNVPSCLKSMNDNLIEALSEMDDAVLYTLSATALKDPVRTDAAGYRMGILTRKLEKVTSDAQQDMTDRQAKLKADIQGIQLSNQGFEKWVQDNIGNLQKD